MGRARIFVSHSNSDPDALVYVDAIDQELRRQGFDVLVDRKRLRPGEKWRDEIYTWMGVCHGAVILVSPAAIAAESIWVPRETSILLWRQTLEGNQGQKKFPVVPACLGSVRPEDLRGGVFRDMQLGEIEAAPARTPDELVSALTERFAGLVSPKSPLEILATRAAELLRTVGDAAIEEASELLGVDLGPCKPAGDARLGLSIAMLQEPLRDSLPALEVLAEYLDGSKTDQLLSTIAPSWVDMCAARWLADLGARSENKPVAVLNAKTPFCAKMYVDRASCRPPKTRWPIVHSTGIYGERVAEELAADIERNLIQEFRLEDEMEMGNARTRLTTLLDARQADGRPTFVTLRFSPSIANAIGDLQRLLPSVTFILLSGEAFPDAALLEGKRIRLIEPALKPGEEEGAQRNFDYVRSIIRPQEAVKL